MACTCGIGRRAFMAGGAGLAVASCTTNPETGRRQFTAFMSPQEEARIGAEQHPKLMETFGGAYYDPALARYVGRIGGALALNAKTSVDRFTFTVLDTDIVNAFATPGGYVYVSRGLLALCRDEAEMAGVIGHEIGHVTARHGAERFSAGALTSIGAAIASIGLAIATGSRVPGDLISTGANLYLASYSRDQEFESDMLGVRYNALAGYNPDAMADFLGQLGASARLSAQIRGLDPSVVDRTNYLATHPRTTDRVQAAEAQAGQFDEGGARNQSAFLSQIDGMVFGDQPAQGVVRGREFRQPDLRIAFTVPKGFTIVNGQKAVQAFDSDGAVVVYDVDRFKGRNAADYIRRHWAANTKLSQLERIDVNGLDAGAAATIDRVGAAAADVQLVAIRDGERAHRFTFASPRRRTAALSEGFRRATYSFRKLSEREADSITAMRVDIVTARVGDTAAGFARRMPFDRFRMERWELLNGRSRNDPIRAGEKIKLVAA